MSNISVLHTGRGYVSNVMRNNVLLGRIGPNSIWPWRYGYTTTAGDVFGPFTRFRDALQYAIWLHAHDRKD